MINPDGFWREQAQRLDWIKPFTKVKQTSFDDHHVDIKWFADGTLNVSYNCLDRHLAERGDQVAIIWEGDDPSESRNITYRELHEQVCKFANALRGQDVHRGDVVTIYMPMIPEAVVAMLACARIGAIHSVVFGGFSPEAGRAHHRLPLQGGDHCRRRRARWPSYSTQGQCRPGPDQP